MTIHTDRSDGVTRIMLRRPEALNALDPATASVLVEALQASRDDIVVLTGAGRAFCAGADLKFVLSALDDPSRLRRFLEDVGEVLTLLARHPRPTIAAVNGVAVAGGLELVLACDLAVAAADARIGDGHVNYGLIPGGGSSRALAALVGVRRARWLLLSGQLMAAEEALDAGLLNRVVPADGLDAAVDEMLSVVARHDPEALRRIKALAVPDLETVLRDERELFLDLVARPETRERLEGFAARSAR